MIAWVLVIFVCAGQGAFALCAEGVADRHESARACEAAALAYPAGGADLVRARCVAEMPAPAPSRAPARRGGR